MFHLQVQAEAEDVAEQEEEVEDEAEEGDEGSILTVFQILHTQKIIKTERDMHMIY
jgi:hypothetical protein